MIEEILGAVRASSPNFKNAILGSVEVDRAGRGVEISVVTDLSYAESDVALVKAAIAPYVPEYFSLGLKVVKLTPDAEMIERKIEEIINTDFKAVAATLRGGDITVEETENGFFYTVAVMPFMNVAHGFCDRINARLKRCFCGEFSGKTVDSGGSAQEIEVEEKQDEIEYEVPVRTFGISGFSFLEGTKKRDTAIYIADLNLVVSDEAVICGVITDIRERSYTNKKGVEKQLLSIVLSDGTGATPITYFLRQKSADKIKRLKVGDSIVCTGKNEEFRGSLRYTADIIDYGSVPEGFKPAARDSKPVPRYYRAVKPEPFTDNEQTDLFTVNYIPECLKGKSFVVFDLETTGLNSSPVSGNMDRIIEIGAYKIEDGVISSSFSTFVNPERKLSDEIVRLTGISEDMVKDAPVYADVMPDFFKFCAGSILVGHNIAGFDFKFVDYYCAKLGYILDRKIIDTYPLAQELLFLSNYKLNTVAEKFHIAFNHHRAVDDALATAKIFIELIKMKKSLPAFQ